MRGRHQPDPFPWAPEPEDWGKLRDRISLLDPSRAQHDWHLGRGLPLKNEGGQIVRWLYGREQREEIDFGEYTDTLVREVFRSNANRSGRISRKVITAPVFLGIDQAIPCGLILNELVTNALKYAYPEGRGEIFVEIRNLPNERVHLAVADNGVGFPAEFDWRRSGHSGCRSSRCWRNNCGDPSRSQEQEEFGFQSSFPVKFALRRSFPLRKYQCEFLRQWRSRAGQSPETRCALG